MVLQNKLKSWSLIIAWGFYDLANQFFALNVVSFYLPKWLIIEKHAPEIFYSLSFSISITLIAVISPIIGAISDMAGKRQPFLRGLTILSILFTIFLAWVDNVFLALVFFAIANFGCQAAVVFYNALMVDIASRDKIGLVSGLGKMMGYFGAGLSLIFITPLVLKGGYKASFIPTGISLLIFGLPCMIFIKDKDPKGKIQLLPFLKRDKIVKIFKQLREVAFDTGKFPGLTDFFKSVFFGLCVVNVVILFMSVYAAKVFGLGDFEWKNLIIFSILFAMAGSLISGYISDRIGYKRSLIGIFILWMLCLWVGAFVTEKGLLWVIGALVGISMGSTWVVSRALAVRLVPQARMAEVFGLFNLVGYFSVVVGSLFWGIIVLVLSPLGALGYRIALFSLTGFLVIGIIFLLRIPEMKIPATTCLPAGRETSNPKME